MHIHCSNVIQMSNMQLIVLLLLNLIYQTNESSSSGLNTDDRGYGGFALIMQLSQKEEAAGPNESCGRETEGISRSSHPLLRATFVPSPAKLTG